MKESDVAVLVQSDTGSDWYVNADGRVMGSSVQGFRGQIVELRGVTIKAPKAGEQAVPTDGQSENLGAALQVIREMEGTGLIGAITAMDAEKSYDLILYEGDRLEILIGGTEELGYKIQYLQVILNDLEDYQMGAIDLTFDVERTARFVEKTAPVEEDPEPEDSEETEGSADEEAGTEE